MATNIESMIISVRSKNYFNQSPGSTHEMVLTAMGKVDRLQFLREKSEIPFAYWDTPLKIGFGQTCSQPSTLATLLQLLDLRSGMRVLEIGAGCGYASAITAEIIGTTGYFVGIERIQDLAALAKENLYNHFGINWQANMKIVYGNGLCGYEDAAPYDRIFFSAGTQEGIDLTLLQKQLRLEKGIIVTVYNNETSTGSKLGPMIKCIYEQQQLTERIEYGTFCFVELKEGME